MHMLSCDCVFTCYEHAMNVMKCYILSFSTFNRPPVRSLQDMPKYIVYEDCLLDLFKICPVCSRSCVVKSYTWYFPVCGPEMHPPDLHVHQAVEQPTTYWQRPRREYPFICCCLFHRSRQIRYDRNYTFQ